MSKKAIEKKLKKITSKIVEEYQPEKIILFGSYAWGEPTEDSDVDLLIVKENRDRFITEQAKIRKIINGEIAADILVYSPEEIEKNLKLGDDFFKEILSRGKYLYEG